MLLLMWPRLATPRWQRTGPRNKKEEVDEQSRSSGWVMSVMSLMLDAWAATKSGVSQTSFQPDPAVSCFGMRCAHFFLSKQCPPLTGTLGALFCLHCELLWMSASAKWPGCNQRVWPLWSFLKNSSSEVEDDRVHLPNYWIWTQFWSCC